MYSPTLNMLLTILETRNDECEKLCSTFKELLSLAEIKGPDALLVCYSFGLETFCPKLEKHISRSDEIYVKLQETLADLIFEFSLRS